MVQIDNAGGARSQHPHGHPRPQAHFFQSMDELGPAVDFADAAVFTGLKQFQRNDLWHDTFLAEG
jgi:hypothetical protein